MDQATPPLRSCQVAMNLTETIMVTPAGDVLVSRCRHSSSQYFPQQQSGNSTAADNHERNDIASQWCMVDGTMCNPCVGQEARPTEEQVYSTYKEGAGGLMGGKGVPNGENQATQQRQSNGLHQHQEPKSPEGAPPIEDELGAVPSFDHTDFRYDPETPALSKPALFTVPEEAPQEKASTPESLVTQLLKPFFPRDTTITTKNNVDDNNSNKSQKKATQKPSVPKTTMKAMHGVPTFLSSLAKIQITKVSASPLGSHVLLISSEALLFAYGQNNRGQLGLGFSSLRFVTTPTIVTSLLEGGGKAIQCAAGVDHSLVVVQTEGRRIGRLQKTLASLTLSRAVSSPSRLSHEDEGGDDESMHQQQLYGFGCNAHMKLGLINPPTDVFEDVVRPRRAALHTKLWPGASDGAPPAGIFAVAASDGHSAALVRRASGSIELYTWGNALSGALGFPFLRKDDHAISPQLVGYPAVVDSLSYQPTTQSATSPPSLLKNGEHPVQVALGPSCTLVLTSEGRCFTFGTSTDGLLGQGDQHACFEPMLLNVKDRLNSINLGSVHALATTKEGAVYSWGAVPSTSRIQIKPTKWNMSAVAKACAGPDGSIFVNKTGCVTSCGLPSGRLGRGEVSTSFDDGPQPMFGGLQLWQATNDI